MEALEPRILLSADPQILPLAGVEPSLALDEPAPVVTFAPVRPFGSLIYEGTTAAALDAAGEVATIPLDLDAGQTLSVELIPAAPTIRARLTVLDPAATPLGTATAAAPGAPVVMQTLPVTSGGRYSVEVEALEGTGNYTLQTTLNATLETETDVPAVVPPVGPLALSGQFHFRGNVGPNTVGTTPGDRQIMGLTSLTPAGPPTAATVTQGTTVRPLVFAPSGLFAAQYSRSDAFNPTLTGPWTITATRGAELATLQTPAIPDPELVPLATDLHVDGLGPTPTVAWTLPDLTGFDVDRIFIRIYDDVTNNAFFQSDALAPTVTTFRVPGGLLHPGGQYVFSVLLDDVQPGGALENRGQAFTQTPFAPTTGAIALGRTVHFRDQVGPNTVATTAGDRQIVGGTAVQPADPPTAVTAIQGGTTELLTFRPSPVFPEQHVRSLPFDPALTGEWELRAARAGLEGGPAFTPSIPDPEVVPFVGDLQILGGGLTPTLTWTLPALTGLDVDQLRVWVYDDTTDELLFSSAALPLATTQFAVPAGWLTGTGQYVFAVLVEDFRGGGILENRSRTFTDSYAPAQDLASSAVTLPGPADRLAATGTTDADEDFYRFQLTAGQTATIVLDGLEFTAHLQLGLLDAQGTPLATGAIGATGIIELDAVIRGFVAPAAGPYFARVGGHAGQTYSLVVTRGTAFEEDNISGRAQDVSLTSQALGALSPFGDFTDLYSVQAQTGDVLIITTVTPGDGPGEPGNPLDPWLELYDPSGILMASDDNSAPDGRNALITYDVTGGSGIYRVVVRGGTAAGDYVLLVRGATAAPAPFVVAGQAPADGAALTAVPTVYRVDLSELLLLPTVQASDLTVNDFPATSVSVLDPDTLEFAIAGAGGADGRYTVTLAPGVLTSLSGKPLQGFSATFVVDTVAPRVVTSAIAPGEVVAAGELTYRVQFSEPPGPGALEASNILLFNTTLGQSVGLTASSYDPNTSIATLHFARAFDGDYLLTLLSGPSRFRDVAGNALDGFPSFPLPSGDGVPGGDFSLAFTVDTVTAPLPPTEPVDPLGSLIYEAQVPGVFHVPGDVDALNIELEAGQTLSAVVTPAQATLLTQIELLDPNGVVQGSSAGSGSGGRLMVGPAPSGDGGVYTIRLTSLGGAGTYGLNVVLNAALEGERDVVAIAPPAGPLALSGQFHFRGNIGPNTVGTAPGDRQIMGLTSLTPAGPPTAATVTQGAVVRSLVFTPSGLFAAQYSRSDVFNPALTGPWTITATRGTELATLQTPAIPDPELVPLVSNLRVEGLGPSPTVTWTLPDLTGFDADRIFLRIYDDVTNNVFFQSDPLPATATEFRVPGGLLNPGGQYIFSVLLEDVQPNGALENRSQAFTPAPFLPTTGAIGLGRTVHFRDQVGPNTVASTAGDRQIVGVNDVGPADPPTAVTATQGGVSELLLFRPSPVIPEQHVRSRPFDPTRTGEWELRATRDGLEGGPAFTPSIPDPEVLPFVGDLQILGGGLTPTLTWTTPDLTGLDVDRLRVWVYDDATDLLVFSSAALPVATTQFAIPTGLLAGTGRYVFAVLVEDLRGGGILENRSRTFTEPYTPAQELALSAVALQAAADRLGVVGLTDADEDFYRFELAPGQAASLVLTALDAPADQLRLDLLNAEGTLLATGVGRWLDVGQAIAGFVAPASGTYFARVSGPPDQDYTLVVTRGAEFELKPDEFFGAQTLSPATQVLGSMRFGAFDEYLLHVEAGDLLHITTSTPGEGPGEPVNTLDPRLALFNAAGAFVAEDDNGAPDGRNAELVYTVPTGAGGAYLVRVSGVSLAFDPSEYTLRVTGATGSSPGLSVIDTTPDDGVLTESLTLVVRLSEWVRADTVQREDLAIEGDATVTGVEIVDGRTIRFLLQAPGNRGTFAYSLAAGAFLDLQGEASLAHHGSFSIERIGPSVLAHAPGDPVFFSFSQLTFAFDEPLDPTTFTVEDVTSFTGPGGDDLRDQITGVFGTHTTFTVFFAPQLVSGPYSMAIGPDIRDVAGVLLDQNRDGLEGQVDDVYTATVTLQQPLFVSIEQLTSGFRAWFTQPLDTSALALYGTAGDVAADVTVVGALSRAVPGSLVVGEGGSNITFIKTGGPLAPDDYTVTLRSTPDGIRSRDGALLDGNMDGSPGDDHVGQLFVRTGSAITVSVPDVARGPGQALNVPATAVGVPIRLSDGAGVEAIEMVFRYDPAFLAITGAAASPGMPAGSLVQTTEDVPGLMVIRVSSPVPLGPGATDLVTLLGHVPETAPYGAMQILDIVSVGVNQGQVPAVADDGLHVVAYFGDTTGNRRLTSLDAQRALRVAEGRDSGFAAFPRLDPVVLADIAGNGALDSADGHSILQEVVGFNRVEIPPLPGPVVLATPAPLSVSGPMPLAGLVEPELSAPPEPRAPRGYSPSADGMLRRNAWDAITSPVEPTTSLTSIPPARLTGGSWVKTFVLELADQMGPNDDIRVLLPAPIEAEPVETVLV
jgi:hypothetical protein